MGSQNIAQKRVGNSQFAKEVPRTGKPTYLVSPERVITEALRQKESPAVERVTKAGERADNTPVTPEVRIRGIEEATSRKKH